LLEIAMPTVTLKNIPREVHAFFKRRTLIKPRSLNSGILAHSERAVSVPEKWLAD